MRSIDNSTPPVIGEPFMETELPNVSKYPIKSEENSLQCKMCVLILAGARE